ncbi:MAG: hypothetical protein O7F75_11185 [Alphaproteobacteria bacterium]|nr:hypothetical protein [Alphaproteobacteria bacterium]
MTRYASLFISALLVTACAQYSLVKPVKVLIGDAYSVDAQIAWNKKTEGKTEIWTVDGPLLQELRFIKGIEDGDTLLEGRVGNKLPTFKSKMTAIEIKELFEASLAQIGLARLKTLNLRPNGFGKASGFRFEFTYVLNNGLEKQGFAIGAVMNDKLYMIIYSGTRLHYYPKHKDDVERLVRSIRML